MKRSWQTSITFAAAIVLMMSLAQRASASEADLKNHSDPHAANHDAPHPTVSDNTTWAGSVVIVVIGMFVAAAVIGPIVRANMPEDVPLMAHDEPPGSSHHHGASGTLEDDHGHGHGH